MKYIVANEEHQILAVYGGALRDDAIAFQKKLCSKYIYALISVLCVEKGDPHVGQTFDCQRAIGKSLCACRTVRGWAS